MNVQTIQVPKAEAEAKLREYRRRVSDSEYARIYHAYEVAASGKPLLILSQAFEQCPRDPLNRPALAIGRADQRQVRVSVRVAGDAFTTNFSWDGRRRHRDCDIFVPRVLASTAKLGEGYSLVPITPPDVARGHDLSRRFVLWEVERWADQRIGATPDRDPYLLERIGDDLYAVVGEWDLTPLEQAIMRDRARN